MNITFAETLYAVTGGFGWIIIAVAVLTLIWLIVGYIRDARAIARTSGWRGLWNHIRVHVLTRKPRHRR